MPCGRAACAAELALLAGSLALLLLTSQGLGITTDEPHHREYGARLLRYYASGGADRSHETYLNLYAYGGAFDVACAAAERALPLPAYEARHLVTAACAWLGVAGAWALGRALGGPAAGLVAALLLLLLPAYLGHAWQNPKDIPFAAAHAWALFAVLRLRATEGGASHLAAAGAGVLIGVALGVRIGGILLLGYAALSVAGAAMEGLRRGGSPIREVLWSAARALGLTIALAWLVMLAAWPWAAEAPLTRPLEALRMMGRFPYEVEVLFAGRVYPSTDLPRAYAPQLLLLQLPALHLALCAAGLVLAWLARGRTAAAFLTQRGALIVAVAALLPVAHVVATKAVLYDRLRHLTFVLPPLCALLGLAAATLLTRLHGRSRGLALIALALAGGHAAWESVRLHPFQAVYLGPLVGGVRGGEGRYDLDTWDFSVREAIEALQLRLAEEARGAPTTPRYGVALAAPQCAELLAAPLRLAGRLPEADFFVATTEHGAVEVLEGDVYLVIQRDGVPLCVVKDRRRLTQPWLREAGP